MLPLLPLLAKVSPATYVKIGAVLLVAGSFTVLNCQNKNLKSERDSLKQTVATVQESNEAYARTIANLTEQRLKDERALKDLLNQVNEINEKDRQNRQTISQLEKTNADVRAYLSAPVPVELRRVLSN